MSSPLVQLAADVVVEPLVSSYPAWWCNVSPLPSALHLTGYQLPALRSFVRSPRTHRKAARDPALAGGPFVNLEDAHAPWVASLADGLESGRAAELELARDYWAFTATLFERGKGQTLEPLYGELPASLRGLVELAYDYHARPFLRFDEGLAYAAAPREHESLRIFRLARDADRPFYMSTPTPPGPGEVAWRTAFDAEATRVLLELDTTPRTLDELRSALAGAEGLDALETLVCPARTATPREAVAAGDVRVDYVGHACVLFETASVNVLFDPFVSPQPEGGVPRLDFRALPERIDFAVVTHAHPDHLALETLLRLRGRIGTLVVPKNHGVASGDVSLRLLARRLGFSRVVDLESLEALALPGGGRLSATPFHGEHGDILHGNKASYVLELEGRSVLVAADSTCLDEAVFERLHRTFGALDTVFMNTEITGSPIAWPFDALFPKVRDKVVEKTRLCRGSNADEGLRLLRIVGAKRLYNYAMGLEPWLERIVGPASAATSARMQESDRLLASARAEGLAAVRLEGSSSFLLPR